MCLFPITNTNPFTSHLVSQPLWPNPGPQQGLALAAGIHGRVHTSVRCVQRGCHCPPCPTLWCPGCRTVGFRFAAFYPTHPPDLVTSYCNANAWFALQAKFLWSLAFLIPVARGNIIFLGHLPISLLN